MNSITQHEINNLPAPPQEWLDALYPKYDTLPTEIWNKIYDIKYHLELKEHDNNKCNFWEHDENDGEPGKKIKFTPMTAKEYQSITKKNRCGSYQIINFIRYYTNDKELEDDLKILCKKLTTQKRPQKKTFIEFDEIMSFIKREFDYMYDPSQRLKQLVFDFNRTYFEDTTVEDRYDKEVNDYSVKHTELMNLCWDSNGKKIKIDRLVSC